MTSPAPQPAAPTPDDRAEPPESEGEAVDRERWEARVEPWAPEDLRDA
jgi:hypothetical protein